MTKHEALVRLDELAREIADLETATDHGRADARADAPTQSGPVLSREESELQADALLAELDAVAESNEGRFDSADDIRQVRDRTNHR